MFPFVPRLSLNQICRCLKEKHTVILFSFLTSADLQINSADLAKLLGSAGFTGDGVPGPLTAAVQASGIPLTPRYSRKLKYNFVACLWSKVWLLMMTTFI